MGGVGVGGGGSVLDSEGPVSSHQSAIQFIQ